MKTTLLAIYIGLTIRLLVYGSIVHPTYAGKRHVAQASTSDSVAVVHHKTMSYER